MPELRTFLTRFLPPASESLAIRMRPNQTQTSPRGLVLGGSSCVGKTTVAKALAERSAVVHFETDRILPSEARFRPLDGPSDVWDRDPQELRLRLVAAAEAATPYLFGWIGSLAMPGQNWILEGERVHPALVEQLASAGLASGVFIVETDSERLLQTLFERLPRFGELGSARRRNVAEVDRLYNLWLVDQAKCRGIPCVESQPWNTLVDRIPC